MRKLKYHIVGDVMNFYFIAVFVLIIGVLLGVVLGACFYHSSVLIDNALGAFTGAFAVAFFAVLGWILQGFLERRKKAYNALIQGQYFLSELLDRVKDIQLFIYRLNYFLEIFPRETILKYPPVIFPYYPINNKENFTLDLLDIELINRFKQHCYRINLLNEGLRTAEYYLKVLHDMQEVPMIEGLREHLAKLDKHCTDILEQNSVLLSAAEIYASYNTPYYVQVLTLSRHMKKLQTEIEGNGREKLKKLNEYIKIEKESIIQKVQDKNAQ